METRTYNVYPFEELTKVQQEKTIENYYDINTDYEWYDCIYEDAQQVYITIDDFDIERNQISLSFNENAEATAEAILSQHGDMCSTYITSKDFLQRLKKSFKNCDSGDCVDCEVIRETYVNDISNEYIKMLSEQYDYLTSAEAIEDTLIVNEYFFTVDGKID